MKVKLQIAEKWDTCSVHDISCVGMKFLSQYIDQIYMIHILNPGIYGASSHYFCEHPYILFFLLIFCSLICNIPNGVNKSAMLSCAYNLPVQSLNK